MFIFQFFYIIFRLSAQIELVISTDNRELTVSLIIRIQSGVNIDK